jgi:hypothetical protein
MEDDGWLFVIAHQGTDIRPFEAAIGYVDGTRLGDNADTPGPDQYVDYGFDQIFFADFLLDYLTQLR